MKHHVDRRSQLPPVYHQIEQALTEKKRLTIEVKTGGRRSLDQNALQWLWMRELAEQLSEETPEGYQAYCKLHFGVPILRGDSDEYRATYDRIIKHLPYEMKLEQMKSPWNWPVTQFMDTSQMKAYLDDVYQHFTGLGAELTEPAQ